jgi:hypothetical protein
MMRNALKIWAVIAALLALPLAVSAFSSISQNNLIQIQNPTTIAPTYPGYSFGAGSKGATQPRSNFDLGTTVNTMDAIPYNGTTYQAYGDLQTGGGSWCFSNTPSTFCKTNATGSGSSASPTITSVSIFPAYLAGPANSITVSGTNIPSNDTVASYDPVGDTITLSSNPTGTVTSFAFLQPSNIATFTNGGTITATLNATTSSQSLQSSVAWCYPQYAGMQIEIPNLGPNGTTLNAHLLGCNSLTYPAKQFAIDTPIATSTNMPETFSWGSNFQQSDIGKTFYVNSWLSIAGNPIAGTITAVYSTSTIQLSTNTSGVVPSVYENYGYGHDDSLALNAAVSYALSQGIYVLNVTANHFAPYLNTLAYKVIWQGTGSVETLGEILGHPGNFSFAGATNVTVVPPSANGALPPTKTIFGAASLRQFAESVSLGVATSSHTYDSINSGLQPNQTSAIASFVNSIELGLQNQTTPYKDNYIDCGVAGQGWSALDTVSTGTVIPCIWSTSIRSLAQLATTSADVQFIGGGSNDGTGLSLLQMTDTLDNMRGIGTTSSSYYKYPDIVLTTNIGHGRTATSTSGEAGWYQMQWAAGVIKSFGDVLKIPVLDLEAETEKAAYSLDPNTIVFTKQANVSYGSNNVINLPLQLPGFMYGYGSQIVASSTGKDGFSFWSGMTAQSTTSPANLVDSRGPVIGFGMGTMQQNS